jgi:hypothetical protein
MVGRRYGGSGGVVLLVAASEQFAAEGISLIVVDS